MDIKNLDELLKAKLGPNKQIRNVDITKPPAKGVGSVMLKVKVTVQDGDNEEELNLVAKKIPDSELQRKIFNIQESFKKEVAFYREIVPILREFQEEENITDVLDSFAEFYGARFNLDENSELVDEDGVMLLDDLSVKGFGNGIHTVGFDRELADKILEDLAKFHGTVVALKYKKPDIFQKHVLPNCTPFSFMTDEKMTEALRALQDIIKTFPDYSHLAEKATSFQKKETPKTCREPFGSIIHFDLWVNNILNRIDEDGTIRNVFVDFQVYGYRSPAADVFFFLWTSIEESVLQHNLDHFLHHYHQNLIKRLEAFGINTSPFGYEEFEEELRIEADFEFGHALVFKYLLRMFKDLEKGAKEQFKLREMSAEFKDILFYMISECTKRGWLY